MYYVDNVCLVFMIRKETSGIVGYCSASTVTVFSQSAALQIAVKTPTPLQM